MSKKLLVVLGMHRSGTSALTRGLKVLGVELGENLLPPDANANAKGFWEDRDILRLNVDILAAMGMSWNTLYLPSAKELDRVSDAFFSRAVRVLESKLSQTSLFGLKDPRVSILLPFWQRVFEQLELDVYYLVASRNPMSVADSLARRDGFMPEKSCQLWHNYMLACLRHTRGCKRCVVDFDTLMAEPEQQLQRVATLLGVTFQPQSSEFTEYCNGFLDPALRHSRHTIQELEQNPAVTHSQRVLFNLLCSLAAGDIMPDSAEYHRALEQIEAEFKRIEPLLKLAGVQQQQLAESNSQSREQEVERHRLVEHISMLDDMIAHLHQEKRAYESGQLAQVSQLEQEVSRLTAECERHIVNYARLDNTLQNIIRSRSWRWTGPLRGWFGNTRSK